MNILVIGGNRFFGKKLVVQLLDQGHNVTVLNRGNILMNLAKNPQIVVGDRNNANLLKQIAESKVWDVIYDQVCYDAIQARQAVEIFKSRVGKYIYTSSQAVYPKGGAGLRECDFDPCSYKFDQDVLSTTNYGEAKRQAEAVFHQQMHERTISVRFPIVVGLDDYTLRLDNHVRAIMQGTPVIYPNLSAEISLISSDQAAITLAALGNSQVCGPINSTAPDSISILALINMIAQIVSLKAEISDRKGDAYSWLDWRATYCMNTDLIASLGVDLKPMSAWLPKLIHDLALRYSDLAINGQIYGKPKIFSKREVVAKVAEEYFRPTRILRFEKLFDDDCYQQLERAFNEKLSQGVNEENVEGKFSRSNAAATEGDQVNRYGAYIDRLHIRETSPYGIFYSRAFFDRMQEFFDFPFSPHMIGSLHHHKLNSPTGWIHSDFHYCNFIWNPNSEQLNPWTAGCCVYQKGYDTRPDILKCYRSVAIIFYVANQPWSPGDGGETCFFKTNDWRDLCISVPPINNTAVAFEVSPHSYHTFVTNKVNPRNSVAFWFHSEPSYSLKRFNMFPPVHP
jgi:nucleoside-diphosphate-sugar epimerase